MKDTGEKRQIEYEKAERYRKRAQKRDEFFRNAALPISVISLFVAIAKEFHLGRTLIELLQKLLQVFFP